MDVRRHDRTVLSDWLALGSTSSQRSVPTMQKGGLLRKS